MLLTCPKCATRYEVDGSSIPQEGTYAHCASCENIFFVKKKLKATPKETAKTTIPAMQDQPVPQPVAAPAVTGRVVTPHSDEKTSSKKPDEDKGKPALTPEQVAAIMAGLDYEDKPKDKKNDSTELTAQSQIDTILGSVHNDLHEKVITAPIPSLATEKPTTVNSADIEAILESVNAQRPETPVEKPAVPAAKEEVGADDIAAILGSVQSQQPAPAKEAPKTATASDIDDIFASVQAQQTPPAKEAPKTATASDIDDIFASVQAQQTPPAKEAPKTATASDIDDIFASVQAQQTPPAKEAPKTASADDIDAIFAGSSAAPSTGAMDSQDDIDSILMTASTPAPQESILEKETVSTTQALSNDDIDSILANVKTEKESPAASPTPATPKNDDIISQSDLDSLFAAASAPSAPAAAAETSKETEGDMISQSDLDALLGETKTQPAATAAAPPESNEIISQGDLDALMSGGETPKAASTASADQLLAGGDDEMDSLFAEEAIGSLKTPAPKKAAVAAAAAATAAPAAEYEGVDTSMFEGLDKVVAEAPAVVEEQHAEAEAKPGKLAGIIAYIKGKLPKRKEKEQAFTVEEEPPAETDQGEAPKKKKTGILAKIALPMAAGVALMLGAGWYYFVKLKPHPVVMAKKAAPAEKPVAPPAQPATEEKKETSATPPIHEEAKAEVPSLPVPPPAQKPEHPPAATAQAPKPKDAKEIAEAAHEEARKAALEADKLIPPSLVEPSIMKVGVMLPVDFNSSQVKMMTAEVELQFATSSEYKTAETKKFVYELALENEIEVFFKDKFYEETRYAKDRLMAYLFERIKKRGDLEKIVGVNVAELTLK